MGNKEYNAIGPVTDKNVAVVLVLILNVKSLMKLQPQFSVEVKAR
jgi:hypothetical protein